MPALYIVCMPHEEPLWDVMEGKNTGASELMPELASRCSECVLHALARAGAGRRKSVGPSVFPSCSLNLRAGRC